MLWKFVGKKKKKKKKKNILFLGSMSPMKCLTTVYICKYHIILFKKMYNRLVSLVYDLLRYFLLWTKYIIGTEDFPRTWMGAIAFWIFKTFLCFYHILNCFSRISVLRSQPPFFKLRLFWAWKRSWRVYSYQKIRSFYTESKP